MSTFNGIFKELPHISADRFEAHNLYSKLFFLSHCHADHMIGLQENSSVIGPIYTSPISAVFLRKQFPKLKNICVLEIETPTQLEYYADGKQYSLVVTTLPAQHCPGSIMLLFETGQKTVLYTGDFRLTATDLERNTVIQNRTIDAVYLDSTFLHPIFTDFPPQTESVNKICEIIREWLNASKLHKVVIEMPAQYGYENLYVTIGDKLNEKIFVPQHQFEKYLHFPLMDQCVSNDEQICRISTKMKRDLNSEAFNANVRIIKPSAMYWTNWKRTDPFVEKEGDNSYRVAYSNHSSCSEIKEFLDFLKPASVNLNVVPKSNEKKISECLKNIYTCKTDDLAEPPLLQPLTTFANIFNPKTLINIRRECSTKPIVLPKRKKLL